MKRRRKRLMVIIPVAAVCVAGAGTVGYFKVAHTKPAQKTAVETQSAEAKKGNLSKTIVGTGNLDLAEAEDQDAPSGLEISEVMAESGDQVKEGDVLAVVDESSILEAMEQVQSEISELDESIREYQDSDEENVIEALVSGRVKKINVSAGSDVSDTMVSDGALMVLSLDGKMAVSLNGVSGVSAGDSVTVTLSSGTQVTGTVDFVSGKECMVTLTDNGTTYGDTVTVTDTSGKELGSGELVIHEPLEITGVSVSVPKDEEMKQGMNASATITIENRENVITIPVNALQERGEKVFVYTEKDEDGNLSGETEVTTGLSDGSTVEITEGLSEGDTVYYNKTGNTDSGNSSDSGMPGEMDGMNGGPGGNSDSGNGGGPGGNGGPGGGGNSGGGGTPPNM